MDGTIFQEHGQLNSYIILNNRTFYEKSEKLYYLQHRDLPDAFFLQFIALYLFKVSIR